MMLFWIIKCKFSIFFPYKLRQHMPAIPTIICKLNYWKNIMQCWARKPYRLQVMPMVIDALYVVNSSLNSVLIEISYQSQLTLIVYYVLTLIVYCSTTLSWMTSPVTAALAIDVWWYHPNLVLIEIRVKRIWQHFSVLSILRELLVKT